MLSEDFKVRQQLDTITPLLVWLKSKKLTTSNVGEIVEQQKPSFSANWSVNYGDFGK